MPETSYWERYAARRIRRRVFLGGVAVTGLGAAGFVAGCGGKSKPAAPESTGTAATSATAAPVKGGTLTLHDDGDPPSFDYMKTPNYRSVMYAAMVYPRLLKYATGPGIGPIDYRSVPDLAAAMPEQPDTTTYVFKLRKARWEEKAPLNGRAVTAHDVLQNWERFRTASVNRLLLKDVNKVEAVDDQTVRFTLSKPLGPFLNHLTAPNMFCIQPPELFDGDQLKKDMWSAGPFLFRGYQVGAQVAFERNPSYFIPDRPYLDRVLYKIVPDPSTTMSALRTKDLDSLGWTGVVGANDVSSLKGALPGGTFLPYPRQGNNWLGFDLNERVFQDKRVRQALSMSLNRDDLIRPYGQGMWCLPYGVLNEFYFDPTKGAFPNAKYYAHNPGEAKALLSAAGADKIGPYDFLASNVWTPGQLQDAELTQQELKAVGVTTNLKSLPFAEFYSTVVTGGKWKGGFAIGANLVAADPDVYFAVLWAPGSPRLLAPGLGPLLSDDAELLAAIEKQRRELDPRKRTEDVKNVVDIMADRMYNVPHVLDISYHIHQANVHMSWIFTMGQEYLVDAYRT